MTKPKRAKLTLKPKPAAVPKPAPAPALTPPPTTVADARRWLTSTYPSLFVAHLPLPFAVGFFDEVLETLPETISRRSVRRAMQAWCNRPSYHKAVAIGAHRYGLDCKPAGEISEKAREHAKQRLTVPKK
jgi:sRNA-binding protein